MIRVVVATVLALAGGALLSVGVLALDARATLLETDHWVDVTRPVVAEPAVRHELSGMLVDAVAVRIACRGTLESLIVGSTLGDKARATLAGRIEQALATKQVQEAWVDANRASHKRFVQAVGLDEQPGDRLLDIATLLDAVGSVVDHGASAPASPELAGTDECVRVDDANVQLVDPDSLHRAADVARVLHEQRRLPELLLIAGGILLALSLLCMRPVTTLAAGGLGAAGMGLGWVASRSSLLGALTDRFEAGQGGVTARAIASAVLDPALTHQLAVGIAGVVAVVIAVIIGVARGMASRRDVGF